MTLKTGTTLGPYKINKLVGVGGMGEVYAATDTRLNREVALKALPDHLAADPDRRVRFEREARMLASLNHPNVAAIYGIEDAGTTPVLVLEYVEGPTLDERIADGPMAVDTALALARQIVIAVAAAHERGIIHRDLKPANVKIAADGTVKVLDFGIAKALASADAQSAAAPGSSPGATRQGQMIGTPDYMSPEQAEGKPIDARSDVFALGTMLYEMLCGRRPFEGDTPLALLASILRGKPVPPRRIRPDIPVAIERVVLHCLEKDPADRFDSADELLDALDSYLARPGTPSRWLTWLAAAGLVVAVAAAGLSMVRSRSDQDWVANVAIPDIRRLIGEDRPIEATALLREAESRRASSRELLLLEQDLLLAAARISTTRLGVEVSGVEMLVRDYQTDGDASASGWQALGSTPVVDIVLPAGPHRFLLRRTGEPDLEIARFTTPSTTEITIDLGPAAETHAGMVYVDGIPASMSSTFSSLTSRDEGVPGYWIDQNEVTNQEFGAFLDAGGYANVDNWLDAPPAARADRLRRFVDAYGEPGPRYFEQGQFPPGETGDDPVSGVNWFEAAAYCRFVGKELPTIYHWYQAAGTTLSAIIPASNFGDGKAAAGEFRGTGPYGTLDMAGNVREWVVNPAGANGELRFVLGGSWEDPTYQFGLPNAADPEIREAVTGFRCARYRDPDDVPPELTGPVERYSRDHRGLPTASEDEYLALLAEHRSYPQDDPDPREGSPERTEYGWRKQRVSFRAGYQISESDRADDNHIAASIYLPEDESDAPYPTAIYLQGANGLYETEFTDGAAEQYLGFLLRAGWVVVMPDIDGTLSRCCSTYYHTRNPPEKGKWQTLNEHWSWDLSRTIDYLETRSDIDLGSLTLYGSSLGAAMVPRLAALEPERIHFAVLLGGGTFDVAVPEDVDPWRFAPHVRQPVLMLNGCYDYNFEYESSQVPLYEALGSDDKEHFTLRTQHGFVTGVTRNRYSRRMLSWLGQRLDPVADDRGSPDPGESCDIGP